MINDAIGSEKRQPAERWEQQIRKGALEMAILAALWSGRLYGLEIIRRFEDSSQLALAEGTIYPILSRLKSEGLLTSEWVEAEAGHPRKYYQLTAPGRVRLQQMAETWTEFSRELGRLIKPAIAAQKEEVMR
jgi:PadR family transcriptional regulator, regulatory protein PadR